MKKVLVIGALIVVIFMLFNQNMVTWVKSTFASSQSSIAQQRLEFFEKLSREYYGTSDYGKELALVNRAVDITRLSSDLTELIIPSLDAVARLKERQTLASIENQRHSRLSRTVSYSSGKEATIQHEYKTVEHSKSSMLFLVIGIIVIFAIISLLSYLKYRSKARRSDLLKFSDEESIMMDDSILIDFDLVSFEEKRQQTNLACFESIN